MKKGKSRSPNWGGARDNAGRKSIWNHQESCTIRIPTVFASKLHAIAQKWDKDSSLEFDINSSFSQNDYVTNSNLQKLESKTESSQPKNDSVTKTTLNQTVRFSLLCVVSTTQDPLGIRGFDSDHESAISSSGKS